MTEPYDPYDYCTTGGELCHQLHARKPELAGRLAKALWIGAVAVGQLGPDGEGLWETDDDSRRMRKLVEELGFETIDSRCAARWALKGDPEWDDDR